MLRAQSDGILTTSNTVKEDNPMLDCRLNGLEKYSPLKIIVDRRLELKKKYSIFRNSINTKVIVYHNSTDQTKIKSYPKNANLVYIKDKKNFLNLMLIDLANRKIKNLLIESGTTFGSEMIKAKLIDQIAFFRSNKIIGNDGMPFVKDLNVKKISNCLNMKLIDFKMFDNDVYELRRFC
tara:strand:- start:276 stop:812 length:537 start_codon:yes stop_codon:yes gene_type:complete